MTNQICDRATLAGQLPLMARKADNAVYQEKPSVQFLYSFDGKTPLVHLKLPLRQDPL